MLSLRLAIFAALSAVALWGLFSLLDTLREPELLRSPRAVVVKGCDPIESEQAARLCPQLFCQKSLLDARALPPRSAFEITVDRKEGEAHFIGGIAHLDAGGGEQRFACLLRNGKITAARIIEAAQLDAWSAQPGQWSFD